MNQEMRFCRLVLLGLLMGTLAACTFEAGEPVGSDNSGWEFGERGDAESADGPSNDVSFRNDADGSVVDGPPDVGDVSTPVADVGVADVGVADVGVADVGVADVGVADVDGGVADVGGVEDVGDTNEPDTHHEADVDHQTDVGADAGAPPLTCGGEVVDISRDPSNCGSCANACGAGERCVDGQCACRPGLTPCGGECVDTQRTPLHCGACDQNCGFGRCFDGACGSGRCGVRASCSEGDGLACIAWTAGNQPLYCAPTFENQCGTVCAGDEICAFAGTATLRCRTVRPGLDCTECPCAGCVGEERCVVNPDGMTGVFCLER